MAIITVGYRPELSVDAAFEAFARHFTGKYDVYPTKIRSRDFIVKESPWAGIGVRLKQEKDGASFVFTGMIPNPILQALFGGLLAYLLLRPRWKVLEDDVADFIETRFPPVAQLPKPARRARKKAA
jgi:hypothetical protein